MELAHIYVKLRKEFGKQCKFTSVPAESIEAIPTTNAYDSAYLLRNPSITCLDTAPNM